MRNTDTMRRTGRDRRDAGSFRKHKFRERERHLARSEAREFKGRAFAWNGEACAALQRIAAPAPVGIATTDAVRRSEPVLGSETRDAPLRDRPAPATIIPIEGKATSTDRSWLPEVGVAIVIAGVRIAAIEVTSAPERPFYVLTEAD